MSETAQKATDFIIKLLRSAVQGALIGGVFLGMRALLGHDDLWLVAYWAGVGGALGYWNGKG